MGLWLRPLLVHHLYYDIKGPLGKRIVPWGMRFSTAEFPEGVATTLQHVLEGLS